MKPNKFKIIASLEFQDWFDSETCKSQVQIAERLSKVECYGHFGDHKNLTDEISELRWKNGRRVYYASIVEANILLLLGGNKNGQGKDITQAKKIFKKYVE